MPRGKELPVALIESVNYHLWRTCNMRCAFCFATYDSVLPRALTGGLPLAEAKRLISLLSDGGFRKITFAGGEPTLCPWLPEIIAWASGLGLRTAVVSNGSRLDADYIDQISEHLDWFALSLDSVSPGTNLTNGRAIAGRRPLDTGELFGAADRLRRRGVLLKVNTVVTAANRGEILLPAIGRIRPRRWKIMQALEIAGENDRRFRRTGVSGADFRRYVTRNSPPPAGTVQVVEDNDDMLGSYVMVDPAGRFIENASGSYRPSPPILEVGVAAALETVAYDWATFAGRGGLYDW